MKVACAGLVANSALKGGSTAVALEPPGPIINVASRVVANVPNQCLNHAWRINSLHESRH